MTTPSAEQSRPHTVVFRDIRPFGGPPVDLTVVDGVIDEVRAVADGGAAGPGPWSAVAEEVDCGGMLALPSLVDAHIHPDKTSWGEPWYTRRRPAHGIADHVQQDVELYRSLPTPVGVRAHRLMAHAAASGTRAMRAHADVAPAYGLEALAGVNEARDALAGVLDVQIVGFPQHGLRQAPGTDALLDEAARGGLLDLVGGIDPAGFDDDPEHLDTVFALAERHRLGVDIHLHDRGERGLAPLREIIARTRALDMGGHVTVSHVFCIPGLGPRELDELAGELAAAGVSLTTVAADSVSVLPHRRLRAHGVRVGIGSDGVRDAWSPFGTADMLHRAHLLGYCTGARLDEELDACYLAAAHDGAALVGLPTADLAPGAPADFLLVDGECLAQAVVDVPRRRMVVRAGRVVARDGALCR
ncbi:amidohydrolase [Streptomyces sp. NPDC059101]|uniref:amidohydrolase n=1 Tax=unclassified Streptomyces TaxID=2593676 RepID=UPI0036ABD5C8